MINRLLLAATAFSFGFPLALPARAIISAIRRLAGASPAR